MVSPLSNEPVVLVLGQGLDVHQQVPCDTFSARRSSQRAGVREESISAQGAQPVSQVNVTVVTFFGGGGADHLLNEGVSGITSGLTIEEDTNDTAE